MYYSYGICSFAFGKGKGCGRCNVHTHRAHRPPEERGQNAHTLEPGTGTVPRRSKEPHAGDSVPDRDGGHQTQGGHQPGEGNPGAAHRKQQGHETNGSGRTTKFEKFRPGTRLCDINKRFCTDYAEWLQSEPLTPQGKPLAQATACSCFWILGIILSAAWQKGYIKNNPWKLLSAKEKIARPESKREFLTLDEVRKLEDTPYIKENIRRAFLFTCYCGLRVGDVTDLCWSDISVNGGQHFVSVVMQKNSKPISLPLPAKALSWLPERGEPEASVFSLPSHTVLNKHLRKWAELAGLDRHLHFHLSRHTYGTMLITAGVDLYTASKMMGHADVRPTQVYAKIVDRKKEEAVSLIDKVF